MKDLLQKATLILVSSMFAVLLGEGGLRLYKPYGTFDTGKELDWMRNSPHDLSQVFTIDSAFGFRPKLGNNQYSEFGTKRNAYPIEKRVGVTRLLFLGDSVTFRAKIIDALMEEYGEQGYEYWNAGVEAFNTVQEVAFYKRFNARISPDHVVLTFHLNDFETTPIAFMNRGKLVVYAPNRASRHIDPLLFEYSYIYRMVLGLRSSGKARQKTEIDQEIEAALLEMRDLLGMKNIPFTVLVLPYMKSFETWSDAERASRDEIVSILSRLEIRHFDLLDVLENVLKEGLAVQQTEGDFWHPNQAVSDRFAQSLHTDGLF